MSIIDGNKLDNVDSVFTLIYIENFIKILSTFNGKVFGEYVREVAVPRIKNSNCDVIFDCLDIWFTNEIDKNRFLHHIKCFVFVNNDSKSDLEKNIDIRSYNLEQYKYHIYKNIIVRVNIIVSKNFPVYDFDVNDLTYYYSGNNSIINSNLLENELNKIIKNIQNKEANMIRSYFDNMVNHYLTYPIRSENINKLYLNRGWSIFCDKIKITGTFTGTADDAIAKQKLLYEGISKRSTEKINDGILLSPIKIVNARNKHLFIDINDIRLKHKLLSGASRAWTSNIKNAQERIFNIELRITGTPINISSVLKSNGYSDFQIKEIIKNSITKHNYLTDKRDEYLKEIERYKGYTLQEKEKESLMKTKKMENFIMTDEEIKEIIEYRDITKNNYCFKKRIERYKNYKEKELKLSNNEEELKLTNSEKDSVDKEKESKLLNNEKQTKLTNCEKESKLTKLAVDEKESIKKEKESKLSVDEKETNLSIDDKRTRLIDAFILSDELYKKAIINRNKAFFDCINDFEITDKDYISERIIDYPIKLNSQFIIKELSSKK